MLSTFLNSATTTCVPRCRRMMRLSIRIEHWCQVCCKSIQLRSEGGELLADLAFDISTLTRGKRTIDMRPPRSILRRASGGRRRRDGDERGFQVVQTVQDTLLVFQFGEEGGDGLA